MMDARARRARKSETVYDLSEVLLASTGKLRYYGIARVVAEIGSELCKQDPSIRFGVFCRGHGTMMEVFPSVSCDGAVELNVPVGIRQIRLRALYRSFSALRNVALSPIRCLVDNHNRWAWNAVAADMRPIDMAGKTLISCGRPKLIVDILAAMDRKGVRFNLLPLLHDMIPLHDFEGGRQTVNVSSNFAFDNRILVERSMALLANSGFTRREIIDLSRQGALPRPPEVHALQLAHECPHGTEPAEQAPPEEPYLLAVGAMLGRKNIELAFAAMRLLQERGGKVPLLVLAGAVRRRTQSFLRGREWTGLRDRVEFRADPNQTDLVNLYKGAMALVIASRMEGWGLPAGEALWCGTPALCADVAGLRECGGDLGLYFHPDRADELAGLISRLMNDRAFVEAHRRRIIEHRACLRTWSDVAGDLLTILKQVGIRVPEQATSNFAKFDV